jgi:hypothetical protein
VGQLRVKSLAGEGCGCCPWLKGMVLVLVIMRVLAGLGGGDIAEKAVAANEAEVTSSRPSAGNTWDKVLVL